MGQILHRCARTTEALRRAIQDSQESIAALADRYDLNPKTVHKWKSGALLRMMWLWVQKIRALRF
jgi:transposase-like protein